MEQICKACGQKHNAKVTHQNMDAYIECPKCGYEIAVAIRAGKIVHYF